MNSLTFCQQYFEHFAKNNQKDIFSLEKQQSIYEQQDPDNVYKSQIDPDEQIFKSLDFPLLKQFSKQFSYQLKKNFHSQQQDTQQVDQNLLQQDSQNVDQEKLSPSFPEKQILKSFDFPLLREMSKNFSFQFQKSFSIPQVNLENINNSYQNSENMQSQDSSIDQQQNQVNQDFIDINTMECEIERYNQEESNQQGNTDNYSFQQFSSNSEQYFGTNQNTYSTLSKQNSNDYSDISNSKSSINTQQKENQSYVSSLVDLVQYQNKKKVIQKKQIKKQKNDKKCQKVKVSEKLINDLNLKVNNCGQQSIYRQQNIKPNSAHLPTLYMNILVPYLLKTYNDNYHFRCRKIDVQQQQKFFENCDCAFCVEYHSVLKFKQGHYNSNIQDLNNLWKFSRLRVLSKNFALKHVYHKILNRNAYRSLVTFISILLSLPLFLKGIESNNKFYKLL